MQLQHLRYFVALARARHFAEAANACGAIDVTMVTAAPAISMRIIFPERICIIFPLVF